MDNVERNKSSYLWLFNRTDPAKNWQLGNEYVIAQVSPARLVGQCLSDTPSPAAITGSFDNDDDPGTAHTLLGI